MESGALSVSDAARLPVRRFSCPSMAARAFSSHKRLIFLVADLFPNTTFQGMDLSPIQPDWVPQNVSFVVDDIEHEAGWTYDENTFDYIHVRHIVHSMRDRQELWDRIYKYVFKPHHITSFL